MRRVDYSESAFVIEDFLTAQDCRAQIARAESVGFETLPVDPNLKVGVSQEIRNNSRVVLDDFELAAGLWQKVRPYIPQSIDEWTASGLYERFRYYRYVPGETFKRHVDGSVIRDPYQHSKLTLIVYLNDDFDGGETDFYDFQVSPKQGAALVFVHRLAHEARVVAKGTKYVLRTDVMFDWVR